MDIYLKKKDFFGTLVIKVDRDKGIFLIEPQGIINPSLIKADLRAAKKFANELRREWIYVVNTKEVLFPNPLNLMYLSEIKDLPYKPKYYIYAPSLPVRILSKLTNFIIRPDRVISTEEDFECIFSL